MCTHILTTTCCTRIYGRRTCTKEIYLSNPQNNKRNDKDDTHTKIQESILIRSHTIEHFKFSTYQLCGKRIEWLFKCVCVCECIMHRFDKSLIFILYEWNGEKITLETTRGQSERFVSSSDPTAQRSRSYEWNVARDTERIRRTRIINISCLQWKMPTNLYIDLVSWSWVCVHD